MDFTSLSASRIDARTYPEKSGDVGLGEFQGKHKKAKTNHQTTKDVFDALLSTVEGDVGELSENLISANVSFGELASLTQKDLEIMGCKDEKQQQSLLEFFKLMPRQDRSYTQILKSKEAQLFNQTMLQRTSSHLDAMRSALAAANYKLKITPSEDVIVGEKNFASRFVLDALEELRRVTEEIDAQLDALAKETESMSSKESGGNGLSFRLSILVSAVLGTGLGYWIWKTVKSK